MRYHWLYYVLSFLTDAILADFAKPLVPWDNMRVKHTWNSRSNQLGDSGLPNALIDALYEVSDPKHPKARPSYLLLPLAPSFTCAACSVSDMAHTSSKKQVAELVRPHPDTLELVTSWLVHHGVRPSSISTTHGGAWLTVTNVLVSQANQLLGASYQLYRHTKVNYTIIRTVGHHACAPVGAAAALAEAEAASGRPVMVLSGRADDVKPSELRGLYKTVAYVPVATDRNKLGVLGFKEEYPSETDLTTYMTNFRTDVQPPSLATFTVEQVNGGGNDPTNPGQEANTDVQYASAMAYPTPIVFYSIGGIGEWSDSGEPLPGDVYLESLEHLLKKEDIPQTISISYGTYEWNVPREYARALCILFAQLGARGVSVLFPAGDDGVGGDCKDESGNVRFVPEFPASCPYITTVGGTTDYDPEVAAPISGGGFSDHFPRPVYQDVAVSAFLERQGTQYAGLYNTEGRGIPDIAAQALRFPIFVKNAWHSCGGHELLDSRRPPLGFLNFRLYGDGFAGLNDITSGSNPGCGTDGFSAVPGWDPVTGLGTPDFEKLQNIFMIPLRGGAEQGQTDSRH
ncbi:subtilisin-like protein [Lactarius indigo]|nr:subtilisin-like protein [Lactarius indigo]